MCSAKSTGSIAFWGLLLAALHASPAFPADESGPQSDASGVAVPASGPITLSLAASRISGVAPLAVFLDATNTTATTTKRPFHDLEYRWDFGDPAGSPAAGTTWGAGSRAGVSSRNSATGPVAAHLFEKPGTYTVRLTAFNGASTATRTVQIKVDDPDVVFEGPWTTCFSTSGAFTGCPPGAREVTTSDFSEAIRNNVMPGRRLLFRRGETWTTGGNAVIAVTGPGIVGAFGDGPKPVVRMTGTIVQDHAFILFSSPTTPTMKDWRVMDLDLDGAGKTQPIGIYTRGGVDQLTLLRLDAHDLHTAFGISEDALNYWNGRGGRPGHKLFDQIAIVDTTTRNILGGGGSYSVYASARRLALLGNRFDNGGTGSHTVRIPHAHLSVFSNNTFSGAGSRQHELKLHAHGWTQASVSNPRGIGTYSENIVISDNKFIGSAGGWTVTLGPQDSDADERVREIVLERNWFASRHKANFMLLLVWSKETTVRNNIFDTTGMGYQNALFIGRRRGGQTQMIPTDIAANNNTFYGADKDKSFTAITLDAVATNVTVKNNLAYAPHDSKHVMLSGAGASGLVQSNNSTDADVLRSPRWVKSTPSAPPDFAPTAGSYAIDSGAPVPVFSDFFLRRRPRNGVIDRGAVEAP